MLRFNTVQTFTDNLAHLIRDDAITSCWHTAATMSILHDRTDGGAVDPICELMIDSFTVICDGGAQHHGRLPDVLDSIVALLRRPPNISVVHARVSAAIDMAALNRLLDRRPRLLGCAVFYHDVLADDASLCRVRRIEAVDIDARTYHLTLLPQESVPSVVIDDRPDPQNLPAVQPALSALLAATTNRILPMTR